MWSQKFQTISADSYSKDMTLKLFCYMELSSN